MRRTVAYKNGGERKKKEYLVDRDGGREKERRNVSSTSVAFIQRMIGT